MQYLYALTHNALGKFAEYGNTRRAPFAPKSATAGSVAGASPGTLAALIETLANGYVMVGLVMYAASALVWLLVLARLDVSVATPSSAWASCSRCCSGGGCSASPWARHASSARSWWWPASC